MPCLLRGRRSFPAEKPRRDKDPPRAKRHGRADEDPGIAPQIGADASR
jgi:hypothetical protein